MASIEEVWKSIEPKVSEVKESLKPQIAQSIKELKGVIDEKNKALSEMRATSVREELIKGGVPSSTITVIGMGRENPISENNSAAGRAQNRRVEIEITVDASKVPSK